MADDDSAGALYQLWHPMIQAAVDSDARCHGLAVVDPGYCWYDADTSTWIDAEGNGWGAGSGKEPLPELRGWNPKTSAMHWAKTIPPLWRGWDQLPDPSSFGTPGDGDLGTVYDVIAGLGMEPDAKGYAVEAGDPELSKALNFIQTSVGGMDGQAMVDFNEQVSSGFATTLKLQAETAAVVAFAIQAEQKVWESARKNLMTTAHQAVVAFEHAHPGGGDPGSSGWMKMLGAVADALSLTPIGKAADLLKKIGTASKSGAVFKDASQTEHEATPMDASTPAGVVTKLVAELELLAKNVATAESAIAAGCRGALAGARADVHRVVPRPALADAPDEQVLALDVELYKLQRISVNLGDMGRLVRGHGAKLSGVPVAWPWDRPDGIGANPHADVAALAQGLQELVATSASRMELAGDRMAEVAADFGGTDGRVADGWVASRSQMAGAGS